MNQDDFNALPDYEQENLFAEFLHLHPEHPQNIDNGQDFSELFNDREFIAWLANARG